jgi:8-oxo-dGTP pyrophosphatase MutT (NUDIX family)
MRVDPDHASSPLEPIELVISSPPTVVDTEVVSLALEFGMPVRRSIALPADASTRTWRFGSDGDRRAEVVFAIQDRGGGIWLHTKRQYPRNLYRLPSGGIHWHEPVRDALFREVREETGLAVQVSSFVGLLEYQFHDAGQVANFASYVFLLHSKGGRPVPCDDEEISGFRLVSPAHLMLTARTLRRLPGDRAMWGAWRALAVEMVYDALNIESFPDC